MPAMGGFERKPGAGSLINDRFLRHDTAGGPGKRTLTEQIPSEPQIARSGSGVQRKASATTADVTHDDDETDISASSARQPFADQLQRAFGYPDAGHVQEIG